METKEAWHQLRDDLERNRMEIVRKVLAINAHQYPLSNAKQVMLLCGKLLGVAHQFEDIDRQLWMERNQE